MAGQSKSFDKVGAYSWKYVLSQKLDFATTTYNILERVKSDSSFVTELDFEKPTCYTLESVV